MQYCQAQKGLEIYAYCIMHSHIHLFCKATNGFILSDVMRDFKKYTSKKIIQTIIDEPELTEVFIKNVMLCEVYNFAAKRSVHEPPTAHSVPR